MDTSTNKSLTTPIRTSALIFCVCALFIIIAWEFYLQTVQFEHSWRQDPLALIPVLIVGIITCGFHHTITSMGLILNFYGISVRRLPWTAVTHAIHIRTWKGNNKHKVALGNGVFVSLFSCPPFDPEHNNQSVFRLTHPFDSMLIWLPDADEDAEQYIALFKAYYPALVSPVEDNP